MGIYDVIVEPPSVGSTTDEHGHTRPVAFMPYRVNGQYIMEGLASSFMFSLGGAGMIILDQTHNPQTEQDDVAVRRIRGHGYQLRLLLGVYEDEATRLHAVLGFCIYAFYELCWGCLGDCVFI